MAEITSDILEVQCGKITLSVVYLEKMLVTSEVHKLTETQKKCLMTAEKGTGIWLSAYKLHVPFKDIGWLEVCLESKLIIKRRA